MAVLGQRLGTPSDTTGLRFDDTAEMDLSELLVTAPEDEPCTLHRGRPRPARRPTLAGHTWRHCSLHHRGRIAAAVPLDRRAAAAPGRRGGAAARLRHPLRAAGARPDRDRTRRIDTFNELGLGLLFFLAGYELERDAIRGRGRSARRRSGGSISFVLALAVVWRAHRGRTSSPTSSASPSPHEHRARHPAPGDPRPRPARHRRSARYFMGAGAPGEFGPILAIALLLGSRSRRPHARHPGDLRLPGRTSSPGSPGRVTTDRLREVMDRGHSTSSQTAVRWTVVLLLGLLDARLARSASTPCSARSSPA